MSDPPRSAVAQRAYDDFLLGLQVGHDYSLHVPRVKHTRGKNFLCLYQTSLRDCAHRLSGRRSFL
jgi:hypothetical protein